MAAAAPSQCFLVHAHELQSMYTVNSSESENRRYSAYIKYVRKDNVQTSGMSAWKLGFIVASGGLFMLMVCVCAVVGVMRWRRREDDDEEEEEAFLDSLPGLPPRFSFKDLDTATNGFSKILGEGGFGTVFQGVLHDGTKVAVKRLGRSRQGNREFRAEVATIGSINHLHLVRLRGFCSQGSHRMLVYEFMMLGSLERWLFRDIVLEWAVRYRVAVDTAKGLAYLHHECRHKIIHLDVKPQNILLDGKFRAKVADFGMSKLFDQEMTEVVTRMRGTPGYLAPEWLLQTGITERCDVFSYGMVLLEIVSGRKNVDADASPERWFYPGWAVHRMQKGAWREIVDPYLERVLTEDDWAQAKTAVMVALWCIQDSPRLRPTMAAVVQMLEGVVAVKEPPLQFDFLAIGSRDLGPPIHMPNSSSSCGGSLQSASSSASQSSGPFRSPPDTSGIMKSYCDPDSNPHLSEGR